MEKSKANYTSPEWRRQVKTTYLTASYANIDKAASYQNENQETNFTRRKQEEKELLIKELKYLTETLKIVYQT